MANNYSGKMHNNVQLTYNPGQSSHYTSSSQQQQQVRSHQPGMEQRIEPSISFFFTEKFVLHTTYFIYRKHNVQLIVFLIFV